MPLDGLEPAATYQMVLFETDTESTVTIGFVETLPDRLPLSNAEGVSQRPFTIVFGSCYYAPDDPDKKVDQAYIRLWNSPEHRPSSAAIRSMSINRRGPLQWTFACRRWNCAAG